MDDYDLEIMCTTKFAKRVQPHPVIEFIYLSTEYFKVVLIVVRTYSVPLIVPFIYVVLSVALAPHTLSGLFTYTDMNDDDVDDDGLYL